MRMRVLVAPVGKGAYVYVTLGAVQAIAGGRSRHRRASFSTSAPTASRLRRIAATAMTVPLRRHAARVIIRWRLRRTVCGARAASARHRRPRARPHEPPPLPAAAVPGGDGDARANRHHGADPLAAAQAAEHDGADDGGERVDPERQRGDHRQRRVRVRFPDRRRGGAARVLRASRVGAPRRASRASTTRSASGSASSSAFEQAELTDDPTRSARALLSFVIIGGGPTGVELAGMLPTIARHALPHDFRRIATMRCGSRCSRAGTRILPTYPGELSEHARHDLEDLGVEVRTGALVTTSSRRHVRVGDEVDPAHTVIWAAGNAASPLGTVARCASWIAGPGAGAAGPERARASGNFRRRRHGGDHHAGSRCPVSRRRPCRWAPCGAQHPAHPRGSRRGAVRVSQQGRPRDDRPPPRHRRLGKSSSRASSRGGSGCSSTSCIWPAFATASAC